LLLVLLHVANAALPSHPPARLGPTFRAAAQEAGVPPELLLAIAYEASGLREHGEASAWGGRGLFDFVENDEIGGPNLERASALIEADPNQVLVDWRLAARAAAALLADQARELNEGDLPATADLNAWEGAVTAFSGRDEPMLQRLYVEGIYTVLQNGFEVSSRLGNVSLAPQEVEVPRAAAPPPGSTDYSSAAAWTPACSDNYTDDARGSSDIDLVIIHTVQGSYSGCVSWFQNCSASVSAHYVVRSSDGQVTQSVRESDIAWHAGNWDYNSRSVGIEHEGYISDCSYYTEAMYKGSAALTRDIASRQGVPLDRSHIIGHNEVPDPDGSGWGGSGNHTDPGSCWDWDYYMALVTGGSGVTTGEVLGYVRAHDIYNTEGNLVGATVRIEETGDTTTVGADGLYRFDDLPFGTYTVRASLSGYAEGTCSSELGASQDWCSIALSPGGGDTGAPEPEVEDTGSANVDEGSGPGEPSTPPAGAPGRPVALDEAGAGCNSAAAPAGWLALAAAVGLRRARRR
jgi:N-acetyl-anhydromuramyl-L-alanine amidase AmpD